MTLARRNLLTGFAVAAGTPWTLRNARAEGTPKRGGILRAYHPDSPASMSMLEETTISVIAPMTAVFNNLIVYDPHVPQNSMSSIIPDLATAWSWSDGGKQLDFTLRRGVKWHDGKPFTAADVVHTWNLILGKGTDKLRVSPRTAWYANLEEVFAKGDDQASFRLKRPQPALVQVLAAAASSVYPAHIPARDMRTTPIGTGPFRFVEYKRGEVIRFARNDSYWKPDRPFLDGIEWWIVPNRSTAILGFVSGRFDLTFPATVTMPLLKDVQSQAPNAVVHIGPTSVAGNVTINHTAPPFNDPRVRRALALALDRAEFIRILSDGRGLVGGAMMPPPNGAWGLTPDILSTMHLYTEDVEKRRVEARQIMSSLGYGPDKRLEIAVSVRNLPNYRDAGIVMIDQLRNIWIEGTLDSIDTAVWDAKMIRKNFVVAFNQTGTSVDDPDVHLFENYACGSHRNFAGYCDADMEKLMLAQSLEADQEKRKRMVWEIDKRLQEEAVRPIMYHNVAATCWQPRVHDLTPAANSQYNGWRMEDAWLDS